MFSLYTCPAPGSGGRAQQSPGPPGSHGPVARGCWLRWLSPGGLRGAAAASRGSAAWLARPARQEGGRLWLGARGPATAARRLAPTSQMDTESWRWPPGRSSCRGARQEELVRAAAAGAGRLGGAATARCCATRLHRVQPCSQPGAASTRTLKIWPRALGTSPGCFSVPCSGERRAESHLVGGPQGGAAGDGCLRLRRPVPTCIVYVLPAEVTP
jgi:hypothetical protein